MHCSSCGAKVTEDMAFCGACGRPIVGYSVGGYNVGTPASAPAPGAAVAPGYVAAPTIGSAFYAGFWLRVVAAIIDGIVVGVPLSILVIAMFASMIPVFAQMGQTPNPMLLLGLILPKLIVVLIAYLLISWLYWALMECSPWQATLGKKALGLYVTDLSGRPAAFGKTSGRFFAGRGIGVVPYVGGLYFLVSCILAGLTEKKQALHDIIAGTLVMSKAQS